MYKCNNCGRVFDTPEVCYETHGFKHGPFEKIYCCPHCGIDNEFEEVSEECD